MTEAAALDAQVMRGAWLVASCCVAIAAITMADGPIVPFGEWRYQLIAQTAILVGVVVKSRPLRWLLIALLVVAVIRKFVPWPSDPLRALEGPRWYLFQLPELFVYVVAVYLLTFTIPARRFFAEKTASRPSRLARIAAVVAIADATVIVGTSGYTQWLADSGASAAPWWLMPAWVVSFFPSRFLLHLPGLNHPFGLGGPRDGLVWAALIAANAALWAAGTYLALLRVRPGRADERPGNR